MSKIIPYKIRRGKNEWLVDELGIPRFREKKATIFSEEPFNQVVLRLRLGYCVNSLAAVTDHVPGIEAVRKIRTYNKKFGT